MEQQRNSKLISTLMSTTDPARFAAVVREGIQMDLTCVKAVPDALRALNIDASMLTIYVDVDAWTTYRFGTSQNDDDGVVVHLDLINNHYQLRGRSSSNQSSCGEANTNDCLYYALADAIPQLMEVAASEFRLTLAGCIETNPEIAEHIRLGRHQRLLRCGVFGGSPPDDRRRGRSPSPFKPTDPTKKTSPENHLVTRFLTLFFVAADVQRISQYLGISRSEVLVEGASEYQGNISSVPDHDAAHVIRIKISEKVKEGLKCDALLDYLKSIIGFTQIVPQWVNRGSIGRNIDTMQAYLLKLFELVDFSTNPPSIVQNTSNLQEHLKNVVGKINELLKKKNKNASAIKVPNANNLTAVDIAETCRQAFVTLLIVWLKPKVGHFMDKDHYKEVLDKVLTIIDKTPISKFLEMGVQHFHNMSLRKCCKQQEKGTKQTESEKNGAGQDAFTEFMQAIEAAMASLPIPDKPIDPPPSPDDQPIVARIVSLIGIGITAVGLVVLKCIQEK